MGHFVEDCIQANLTSNRLDTHTSIFNKSLNSTIIVTCRFLEPSVVQACYVWESVLKLAIFNLLSISSEQKDTGVLKNQPFEIFSR